MSNETERTTIGRSPAHPGFSVRKDVQDKYDMTQEQLATRLGITRQGLGKLLTGRQDMTPGMALRLERLCGIPATEWMSLQIRYDLWKRKLEMETELETITPLPAVRSAA